MRRLLIIAFSLVWVACAGREALPDETLSDSLTYIGADRLPDGFDLEGHRGARGLRPENTLPAFEAALDLGVTTLELDLHLTADDQVVVWHDPVIEKAKCLLPEGSGDLPDPRNPLRRILISQQPLEVVQAYRCDLNPEPDRFPDQTAVPGVQAGDNYHIITLDELITFVALYAANPAKSEAQRRNAAAVFFNIETKRKPDNPEYIDDGFTGGEAGPFELAILAIIEDHALQDRVVIQSFDHRSLRTIRAINPDIPLAALTSRGDDRVRVFNGYGFDIWSPDHQDVTSELIALAHDLGLRVIPWTVNDVGRAQALIAMGVDGLITDRPDLLLNLPPEQ